MDGDRASAQQLGKLVQRIAPRWFVLRDVHAGDAVLMQPRYAKSLLSGADDAQRAGGGAGGASRACRAPRVARARHACRGGSAEGVERQRSRVTGRAVESRQDCGQERTMSTDRLETNPATLGGNDGVAVAAVGTQPVAHVPTQPAAVALSSEFGDAP